MRTLGETSGGSDAAAVARIVNLAPGFVEGRLQSMGGPALIAQPARGESTDNRLWRAYFDAGKSFEPELISAQGRAPRGTIDSGSLIPFGESSGIEVWTETELSALHAVARYAIRERRGDVLETAIRAARWHVENLQPDNATNRPWSVFVFLICWERDSDQGALLHAQTLIHNCRVSAGVPDTLAGLILLDSAEALREWSLWKGRSDSKATQPS